MPVYFNREIYDHLLVRNAKLKDLYGFTLPDSAKWIGSGTQGAAYLTTNNKVLKITYDASEAYSSKLVIGKNPKYINHIYAVFEIKGFPKKLYGIYQERQSDVTMNQQQFYFILENIWNAVDDPQRTRNVNKKDFKEIVDSTVVKYSVKEDDVAKLLTWFLNLKKELKRIGISGFSDFSYGNIKEDSEGNYRLIDLGWSKSRETRLDILERKQTITIGDILIEVRVYEKMVLDLSRQIVNQIKETSSGKDSEKKYKVPFKNINIDLSVGVFPQPHGTIIQQPGKSAHFMVDAGVNLLKKFPRMHIIITYQEGQLNRYLNPIIADLKDALRHEFEHISQIQSEPGAGWKIRNMYKQAGEEETNYAYFNLPTEISAMVRGLYKRAKTQRRNLQDMIEEYVKSIGDMTKKEEQQTIENYINYAKKIKLPLTKNEEHYLKVYD